MGFKYNNAIVWTNVASLPGGFLNGWSADIANPPQVGLVTVDGIPFCVARGLIKATTGAGSSYMFTLPPGYRISTTLGTYFYFTFAGGVTGASSQNTIILYGNGYVLGGYDDTGTAFAAGLCKDVLLSYAWQVKA